MAGAFSGRKNSGALLGYNGKFHCAIQEPLLKPWEVSLESKGSRPQPAFLPTHHDHLRQLLGSHDSEALPCLLLGCAQHMYTEPFLFGHIKLITKENPDSALCIRRQRTLWKIGATRILRRSAQSCLLVNGMTLGTQEALPS